MAIVVIDYHKGNLSSVVRGLARTGARAFASDHPSVIAGAEALVLPGVGSFADAMDYMEASGQAEAILSAVRKGRPFLGICLGLQLLFSEGDEGVLGATGTCEGEVRPGLGLLPGHVVKLSSKRLKVPHVGWDMLDLTPRAGACPLLEGVPWGTNAYFTHSYVLDPHISKELVGAKTHYAVSFPSVVWQGTVFGTQFHPEKSSWVGERILTNFCAIAKAASSYGAGSTP